MQSSDLPRRKVCGQKKAGGGFDCAAPIRPSCLLNDVRCLSFNFKVVNTSSDARTPSNSRTLARSDPRSTGTALARRSPSTVAKSEHINGGITSGSRVKVKSKALISSGVTRSPATSAPARSKPLTGTSPESQNQAGSLFPGSDAVYKADGQGSRAKISTRHQHEPRHSSPQYTFNRLVPEQGGSDAIARVRPVIRAASVCDEISSITHTRRRHQKDGDSSSDTRAGARPSLRSVHTTGSPGGTPSNTIDLLHDVHRQNNGKHTTAAGVEPHTGLSTRLARHLLDPLPITEFPDSTQTISTRKDRDQDEISDRPLISLAQNSTNLSDLSGLNSSNQSSSPPSLRVTNDVVVEHATDQSAEAGAKRNRKVSRSLYVCKQNT